MFSFKKIISHHDGNYVCNMIQSRFEGIACVFIRQETICEKLKTIFHFREAFKYFLKNDKSEIYQK
jgi:hypothetical protein